MSEKEQKAPVELSRDEKKALKAEKMARKLAKQQAKADRNAKMGIKTPSGPPKEKPKQKKVLSKSHTMAVIEQVGAGLLSIVRQDFLGEMRQFKEVNSITIFEKYQARKVPAELIKLGLRMASGEITGETKLVLAAMTALKEHLQEISISNKEESVRKVLEDQVSSFREICQEFEEGGEGLNTAFANVYSTLAALPGSADIRNSVVWLTRVIDNFITEKIIDSDKFITSEGLKMMKDGDVILVYGYSFVIESILLSMKPGEKEVTIIIVDDKKKDHCKQIAHKLSKKGIQVIYTLIEGVPCFMNRVTKVFSGAVTMYSNGTLLAVSGTAVVATLARTFRKPFYVFCQTFKFSENSQIDSLICNQMVTAVTKQQKYEENFISLKYDLTPMEYISLVISEVGIMPPSSVSVILREFKKYDNANIKYPGDQ